MQGCHSAIAVRRCQSGHSQAPGGYAELRSDRSYSLHTGGASSCEGEACGAGTSRRPFIDVATCGGRGCQDRFQGCSFWNQEQLERRPICIAVHSSIHRCNSIQTRHTIHRGSSRLPLAPCLGTTNPPIPQSPHPISILPKPHPALFHPPSPVRPAPACSAQPALPLHSPYRQRCGETGRRRVHRAGRAWLGVAGDTCRRDVQCVLVLQWCGGR